MEELLALLIGAGALALSPFLIPGLRPVAKSAIKGGLGVAAAAKRGAAPEPAAVEMTATGPAATEAPAAEPAPAGTTGMATRATPQSEAAATVVVEKATVPDDLSKIKGIGPKTAQLLEKSGVTTFEQIAEMNTEQLRDILAKGGSRYQSMDPTPWPDEARRLMKMRKR